MLFYGVGGMAGGLKLSNSNIFGPDVIGRTTLPDQSAAELPSPVWAPNGNLAKKSKISKIH